MPRSKDPRSYSPEYGKTLEKAFIEGEVFVPVPDWKVGKRLQSEFYSFIQAVKKHPEDNFQWLQYCHQVAISLTGSANEQGPQTLRFYNKENSASAMLLRGALGFAKTSEEAKASELAFLQKMGAPLPLPDPTDKPFDYGSISEGHQPQTPPDAATIVPVTNKYYTRKPRE